MGKTSRRGKGDGSLYQRKSDGMWLGSVEVRSADGSRKRKYVSSKDYKTAQRKHAALRREAQANPDLPTASLTIEKWLKAWVEDVAAPNVRPKTLSQYRSDIRLHIIPAIGRVRLDRLTAAHVRSMAKTITGKPVRQDDPKVTHSSTTALRCHTVLVTALNDAVRDGLLLRNVAASVKRPAKDRNERGALTNEQAIKLLRHAGSEKDPLTSLYATALLTGARRGELLGLQLDRLVDVVDLSWQLQRIDWAHGCGGTCGRKRGASCPQRRLEVPPGFEYQVLYQGLCLTRPKSEPRVLPMFEPLESILATHLKASAPNPHGLVWADKDGHPLDPEVATKSWRAAVKAAGLPPVPLHGARHTTASLLLAADVPERVIQQILGHSSVVTSRIYMHVQQEGMKAALEDFGRSFALD